MNKIKVLFVCIHNSARSQMAEAFLNAAGNNRFTAESAGLEKGVLNPLAVDVMKEIGIDISANGTKTVMEILSQEKIFNYVITVCDEAGGQKCPLFPGRAVRLHWTFEDPSSFTGSYELKLKKTRTVRDEMKKKIEEFVENLKNKIQD